MSVKPDIIPALLTTSFDDIVAGIRRIDDVFSRVQVDVVDGFHASNVTWPYAAGGSVEAAVQQLHNVSVSYDLDLMIEQPERDLGQWLQSGARRVIVHLSSTDRIGQCLRQVKESQVEAFVGVVIGDDLRALQGVSDVLDGVQCMGIAEIGKQGEPYDQRVLDLIQTVQVMCPNVRIAVDGGVSPNTIPELLDAGVSCLVVGSAIFRGDISRNIAAIEEAVASSPSSLVHVT